MTGVLYINGKPSTDFGIVLSESGTYIRAERDITFVSVPGRSGDLSFDNNRFKNVQMTYPCIIAEDFDSNFAAFLNYIHSQKGYMRLEDSFHPDEYTMAIMTKSVKPKKTADGQIGTFDIVFNRKPQRYIKSSEKEVITVAASSTGKIINPEYTTSKPLIKAFGTGTITVGSTTITINSIDSWVDIDCENMSASKGTTNCNGNITLNSGAFFQFEPGENNIQNSTAQAIQITPRFWRL